jgi:ABC-type transport system involved in multi-copper enzyme maturation permease subunit
MKLAQQLINPMLEKEFRLRMRTVRAPFSIFIYVAVMALLAFGYLYLTMNNYGTTVINPRRSQELFYFISGAQLVLISFMAPGLTAGVISGERERQTLNILLTTQQSSSAIVLSKLAASMSFMLLVVSATLPIYGMVFLYGGISPLQLVAVFAFYLFMMVVLGSFGVLFSTVFKRTMVSVIVTYGVTLFIYAFTGLLAIFMAQTFMRNSPGPGYILGLNPMGALLSIFNSDFSYSAFNRQTHLQLWHIFVPVYAVLSALAIVLSIRYLRSNRRK